MENSKKITEVREFLRPGEEKRVRRQPKLETSNEGLSLYSYCKYPEYYSEHNGYTRVKRPMGKVSSR